MAQITVNGAELAYDVHGEGEPVLLAPATGQPAFAWSLSQVPALTAAGYQVITFDLRGIAPSEAPPGPYSVQGLAGDAAALLEHVGVAPRRVACCLVRRRDPHASGP